MRSPSARRLRRQYANVKYPLVLLRFEDGHEIHLKKGESKGFDAFVGETIKIVAVWDPTARDREVIAVLKAEQLEEET
ncbi:MAG: hypothetical protein WD825_00775 [Gemmatimonadaceae bacterium]